MSIRFAFALVLLSAAVSGCDSAESNGIQGAWEVEDESGFEYWYITSVDLTGYAVRSSGCYDYTYRLTLDEQIGDAYRFTGDGRLTVSRDGDRLRWNGPDEAGFATRLSVDEEDLDECSN